MEAVIVIVLLLFGGIILRAIFRTTAAVGRTALGKGTLSENMELSFKGMVPLEARLSDKRLTEGNADTLLKEIYVRGLFPVRRHNCRTAFVVSIFDKTDAETLPVISILDSFQEPNNVVFQHTAELPPVSPNQGFVKWERVSGLIPDLLQPPYSGERTLLVVLRLIELDNPPVITHGYASDDTGILWQSALTFTHIFKDKGYKEASENRDEAQALSVKVAVAVAMSDGSFDDREGEVIANWIRRAIEPFEGERRDTLRENYNNALREAYDEARNGDLLLSNLTTKLNEIGEVKVKYDAIELCFEVMAADGEADPKEMRTIRKIGEALELNLDELDAMRDQKIVGLDSHVSSDDNIEELLGIEADWDAAKVNSHLRSEFNKWNNRLNALPEGPERESAQSMLNLIAKARQRYANKH